MSANVRLESDRVMIERALTLSDSFPSSPQCHPFMPFCCWNEFPDLSNENRFRVTGPFTENSPVAHEKVPYLFWQHPHIWLRIFCGLNTPQVFHHIGFHDDVIKRKHIPRYWPFVRGIHRRPGEFPAQRPVTQSFDVFFDQRPNKRLSKQLWDWQFETPSSPLWRHSNVLFARTGMWKLKQFWHSYESMVPVSSIVEHIMKTLAIFAWSGVFISKLTLPALLWPRDFGSLYLLYESRFPIFFLRPLSAQFTFRRFSQIHFVARMVEKINCPGKFSSQKATWCPIVVDELYHQWIRWWLKSPVCRQAKQVYKSWQRRPPTYIIPEIINLQGLVHSLPVAVHKCQGMSQPVSVIGTFRVGGQLLHDLLYIAIFATTSLGYFDLRTE